MFAAWVWWCAVCALCACGVRGAAVDVHVAVAVNGANVDSSRHHYRINIDIDTDPTNYSKNTNVLLVVGGKTGDKTLRQVELLDLELGQWRTVAPLPSPREDAGLAVLNGKVYLVGGHKSYSEACTQKVYVYDIAANTWTAGPPLSECRWGHGLGVIGSTIYAVGGFGPSQQNSAEALDAGATSWRPIADMSASKRWPRVAALDGKLYAIVGDDAPLTVERYDPEVNVWETVPEMVLQRHDGYGVGAMDGALYVVGGYSASTNLSLRSVWRYYPTADGYGGWSEVPRMHEARRWPAVTAHGGKLYVVGGNDDTSDLKTVEVFDPATDTWTLLNATMAVGRRDARAVVLTHVTL